MKRFVVIALAVLLIFGIVASIVSSTQKAQLPEAPAPTDAAASAPAAQPETTAEAVVIRSLDEDAIRALRAPDEVVLSLGGETASWDEYCQWLFSTGRQIEDYFRQMASFYGLAADWEGSVGDGSGMTYAQYAVHETNENLSNILAYRRFAAEEQITLNEEQQAQLTDEALAKALLGENATVEQLTAELEKEGFGIETFRRIRETNLQLDAFFDETYGENGGKVTDEEAVAYLEEKGYVSAGHILLMTIDPNTGDKLEEAAVAEKKLKAGEIADELRAIADPEQRERRFLELKAELCEDGGKIAYPNGYTYTSGTMVTEFESAVNALEPFEVSDPVESAYGYHVIMRLPLRADSLLYSAQGTPVTARQETAVAGMNDRLAAFIEANPVAFAEGIEDLDLVKYLK